LESLPSRPGNAASDSPLGSTSHGHEYGSPPARPSSAATDPPPLVQPGAWRNWSDSESKLGSPSKWKQYAAAGAGAAGLSGVVATGSYLGLKDNNKNNTKRTFEAFEGRASAELVERALGDRDLDK